MSAALYDVKDPRDRAAQHMQTAIGSYARQTPDIGGPPDKNIGGAAMNVMGGAATGASLGAMMASGAAAGSVGAWWGAGIGAIMGAAAYYLS